MVTRSIKEQTGENESKRIQTRHCESNGGGKGKETKKVKILIPKRCKTQPNYKSN